MRPLLIIFSLVLLSGCKKIIEKKAENAIMKAMTDGQWVITSFISDGSNVTTDFSAYRFQYFDNYTVDAIKNGTVENTGNWDGDVNTMNIMANFPNATNPLLLLNGTWHVTDNSWTYVEATMTVGSTIRSLRLDKQ
ncbi:MAG TPA: hypothetical protein VGQ53_17030 [Chitinophagaceae bacterium]|jgi:hypothetical protein|nr:hypothetical protein [Chitinophagaceae bacterium]